MAAPRKDDVEKLILNTMEELLMIKSVHDISLAEIAGKAGISKGTLYYHFKNKDEILFAIMDRYLDQQWQELQEWSSDQSKDTSLPRLVKYIIERDLSMADIRFHFFYEAFAGNETIRKRLLHRYHEFSVFIADIIKERTDEVDSEYLSWLILLLSDGLLLHKLIGNSDVRTEEFIKDSAMYIKKFFTEDTKA